MRKPHPLSVAIVGGCFGAIAAYWLFIIVEYEVRERREYQSIIPFLISFLGAAPITIWPARFFPAGWKRMLGRSAILTFFLAPIPIGPEGTLLPMAVALLFPPLLVIFLGRIALSFVACFGFVAVWNGIWNCLHAPRCDASGDTKEPG